MADELDDLAGVEAFAPRAPGDPDDPFAKAFAEGRLGGGARGATTTRAGGVLLVAIALVVLGLLSVALGIPDDGGDDDDVSSDDVAASLDQTSSTVARASSSTTIGPSTTAGLAAGTVAPATATTVGHTTLTTVLSSTTLPTAPTTTELVNRDLQIEVRLSEPEPAVNQPITIFITVTDPDAVPTGNCQVIRIDDEELFPDDPCDDGCDEDGADAAPTGGTRDLEVGHTFTTEGTYTVEVTAHSGVPECNNPYASVATSTFPVTVGPAA